MLSLSGRMEDTMGVNDIVINNNTIAGAIVVLENFEKEARQMTVAKELINIIIDQFNNMSDVAWVEMTKTEDEIDKLSMEGKLDYIIKSAKFEINRNGAKLIYDKLSAYHEKRMSRI